jgi:hypothetical protein
MLMRNVHRDAKFPQVRPRRDARRPALFTKKFAARAVFLLLVTQPPLHIIRFPYESGCSLRICGDARPFAIITKRNMKKTLLSIALAVAAPIAWAQTTSETTTTTTTTEGGGTITEFSPGSTIVLKESTGPKHYRFGKTVTYVTKSGKTLDEDTVRTRIKVGVPVHVHYVGEGDSMMVDRVILDED